MIRADLHIHTVLSPCGDTEMTPARVVTRARERGLGVIGIADHNSTRQCAEVRRIGEREGVFVLTGAEITTREEVHVLTFVEGAEKIARLQRFLDDHLPPVPGDPARFGYQLVVDEREQVTYEEKRLLIRAIDRSLEQTEVFVHSLGGLFIPAHIDKGRDSLLSQLGFVPAGLRADALEISGRCDPRTLRLPDLPLLRSSDAHYPEEIGRGTIELDLDRPTFESIKEAITQNRIRL